MSSQTPVMDRFAAAMAALPLVAILRGIRPEEAVELGISLYESGFRLIEVPLNSPDPLLSISALRQALPSEVLVGAGTVRSAHQVTQLALCAADLVVMPHADPTVIQAAKAAGLVCVPGVATPTEAFTAIDAGADALKIFPADLVTPAILRSIRVVLPEKIRLLPVGGITPVNMRPYVDAGAAGFGLGSALFKPGMDAQETGERAHEFVAAWRAVARG